MKRVMMATMLGLLATPAMAQVSPVLLTAPDTFQTEFTPSSDYNATYVPLTGTAPVPVVTRIELVLTATGQTPRVISLGKPAWTTGPLMQRVTLPTPLPVGVAWNIQLRTVGAPGTTPGFIDGPISIPFGMPRPAPSPAAGSEVVVSN